MLIALVALAFVVALRNLSGILPRDEDSCAESICACDGAEAVASAGPSKLGPHSCSQVGPCGCPPEMREAAESAPPARCHGDAPGVRLRGELLRDADLSVLRAPAPAPAIVAKS